MALTGAALASAIISQANSYLGNPYVSGGTQPGGFDCSGLVQYVYGKMGINLPRVTFDQVNQGVAVDSSKAAPGDLVFFDETGADAPGPGGSPWGHVGIYIGNGKMISASNPSTGVQITNVQGFSPVGKYQFRRVISNYAGTGDTGMANSAASLAGTLGGTTDPSSGWDSSSIAAGNGLNEALFASDPSLQKVLATAVSEGLTPDTANGAARFTALLQASQWYRDKTDQQRKWQLLSTSDPAEARQQFISSLGTITHLAASSGVALSNNDAWILASENAQFGWTADEQKFAIAAKFHTNKTNSYGGDAGKIADDVMQTAASYGMPVSAAAVGYTTYQVLNGHATQQDYQTNARNYAKGMFPGVAAQIDAGQTIKDIAAPYASVYQNTLEVPSTDIDYSKDPLIKKALSYVSPEAAPPKAGQPAAAPGTMPLWQFEQTLKDDPRWLGTDNAQQSIIGAGQKVLQNMGLTATATGN